MRPDNRYSRHAVQFINQLSLVGDHSGEQMKLVPFQERIIRKLFGTRDKQGRLQYNKMLLYIPRGSAKTTLAAQILIYSLLGLPRHGQQILSCGMSSDQAAIVFDYAKQIIEQDDYLHSLVEIVPSRKRIVVPHKHSFYAALANDPKRKFGYAPSVVLFDELQEQENRKLFDAVTTAFGKRNDYLLLMMMTAGEDKTSLAYEELRYARQVEQGIIKDPHYLPVLYEADDEDDWTSEATWRKSNPGLPYGFPKLDFLRQECEQAKHKAMRKFVRTLGESKAGYGEGVRGLEQLGLAADEIANLGTYDALKKVADGIKGLPGPAEKAAAAASLFGRGGQEMLLMLDSGSEGIEQFLAESQKLSGSFSRVDYSLIEQANDSLVRMKEVFRSVFSHLAVKLAPVITAVVNKIVELGSTSINIGSIVTGAFKGVISAIGFAADTVRLLKMGFKFLQAGVSKAIALVLQDIATLAKGLEWLLNKIPGVEVAFGDMLQDMADGVNQLAAEQFQEAKDEWNKPWPSENVNKFFADIEADARRLAGELGKGDPAKAFLEANKPAFDLLDKWGQQITTFGMTAREAELFKLKADGVEEGEGEDE